MAKKRPGFFDGMFGFVKLIILVFFIRWIVFEIFMIPSGSMYPKLYVSDYIFVTKIDFGIRIPFTQKWVYGPKLPNRSSITVFKDTDDSKYLIKRMIGLPGDKIKISGDFIMSINGENVEYEKLGHEETESIREKTGLKYFTAYREKLPNTNETHIIMTDLGNEYSEGLINTAEDFNVPEGHILFMGDNRHQSYDGRRFGYIPMERLVGRSRYIILSCDGTIILNSGCNLLKLRTDRLGNAIAY